MKTKLELSHHRVLAGENVVELWYNNQFIGTITGADGPGFRFISRHLSLETPPVIISTGLNEFPGLLEVILSMPSGTSKSREATMKIVASVGDPPKDKN